MSEGFGVKLPGVGKIASFVPSNFAFPRVRTPPDTKKLPRSVAMVKRGFFFFCSFRLLVFVVDNDRDVMMLYVGLQELLPV